MFQFLSVVTIQPTLMRLPSISFQFLPVVTMNFWQTVLAILMFQFLPVVTFPSSPPLASALACFSFFQLLLNQDISLILFESGFSFFQLLHSTHMKTKRSKKVLVSFSCYMIVPPSDLLDGCFSFFQLLLTSSARIIWLYHVLVSFSCYRTDPFSFYYIVSFSFFQLLHLSNHYGVTMIQFQFLSVVTCRSSSHLVALRWFQFLSVVTFTSLIKLIFGVLFQFLSVVTKIPKWRIEYNKPVLVSFSCYLLSLFLGLLQILFQFLSVVTSRRRQTSRRAGSFQFLSVVTISSTSRKVEGPVFQFLSVVTSLLIDISSGHRFVLVSFSCYSDSNRNKQIRRCFSFFQLLQRGPNFL